MATVDEILRSALAADKAGDKAAAAKLVSAARSLMPKQAGFDPADAPAAPPVTDGYTPGSMGNRPRPDRFGDTIKDATEGPLSAMGAFATGLADQSQSPSMQAMPSRVPRGARPMAAAVGDLGGLALSGAGTIYATGAGLAGEMFGGSPTGENQLARDLMMMGEVAAPELSGVSSATLGAGRAAKLAEKAAKPLTDAQDFRGAANRIGVTPSLGMSGKVGAMTAAGMEKLPLSAGVIAKDASRAVGQIERAFADSVGKVAAPSGPAMAGERLQSGLAGFVKSFKDRSSQLFAKVDQRMPKGMKVDIPNARQAITETKAAFAENPELAKKLGLGQWDAIMAEAEKNGIPWDGVKQLRTKIGEAIGSDRAVLSDEDIGRLKSLYGALTADMEAATKAAGNGAYGAWRAANSHYKRGAEHIEANIDGLITKDPKNPVSAERAYEAFSNMTKADRASSDIVRMRKIKASLSEEDWRGLSSSIVDRMGRAPAGQQGTMGETFSASKFLTEWNKMTPEAKAMLLPYEVRQEFSDLAKVAERAKNANLERNHSNTGTVGGWVTLIFGSSTNPVATASALGGNYITAKALTSEVFLRAVNRAARGDAKSVEAMAKGSGPYAADAKAILTMMGATAAQTPANNPAQPARVAP